MDKNKFKYFAASKDITLHDLAGQMDMHPATLSKKLSGASEFTRKEIQKYQAATGTTPKEIMDIFF
ncbi:MAG: helix-turn-helix transcriptional regulator [Escherichia coli]|uniref:helix-turn-helix domain-containing protein n=1 Tax=Negativicoccus succinicivorans TaxID=620903 RepID=UPI0028FF9BBB|nr:helix-turn-helix transcriptional regulator [Negativicoccus succinicivorans]MDU2418356.1 helix-turn-helix transcriptional regulator [Negativicoccus succinicivorans]MDU5530326.1 helix-turn-helix transcriptional regulator [Negativicoccus succinicivorans]MDU5593554.1 helix-turn-helix transcriptional regulator [Escherichia coli]